MVWIRSRIRLAKDTLAHHRVTNFAGPLWPKRVYHLLIVCTAQPGTLRDKDCPGDRCQTTQDIEHACGFTMLLCEFMAGAD